MMTQRAWKLVCKGSWVTTACLPFLLISSPLFAEAVERRQLGSTSSLMLQVTLGLLVVIALMFALAWIARRMHLVPGGSHNQALKVLAVLPLSNRERLALVQVGEQQLLLGVTSGQINCLHELDQPIDIQSEQRQPGFAQLLNQWKVKNQAGRSASKDNNNES